MTAAPLPRPDHLREPRPGRRERAADAGWDPSRDDLAPVPAHLRLAADDPWMVALESSRAQVLAWGATACRHPRCHELVSEWDVTYCPHDLPFCEMCVWEDGCDGCAELARGIA